MYIVLSSLLKRHSQYRSLDGGNVLLQDIPNTIHYRYIVEMYHTIGMKS